MTVREDIGLETGVWPATACVGPEGELEVGGVPTTLLARRFGTPVHVVDEEDVRSRCAAFVRALPGAEVAYASKAFTCGGMLRWIREEGLSLDVSSAGELAVARRAGFPAGRVLLHGNGKTADDLRAAFAYGVGRIVIDSASEISRLAVLAAGAREPQPVLLRVVPGVDGGTHPSLTTGTEDQQFGLSLSSGAATDGVRRVLGQRRLSLAGLHFHLGSQIADLDRFARAVERTVEFASLVRHTDGVTLEALDVGGGFAVPYREGDPVLDPAGLAATLIASLRTACARHRFPMPRLTVEPGRAIAARAGVTLYRVIGLKRAGSGRVLVTVDGGMSDNPRPVLYGARYTVRLANRTSLSGTRPVTVVGRHCEAGDVLVPETRLPADLRLGDVLAVACTGAYHHAMASNYNLVRRPPVVAVCSGAARLLVRRETEADLLARDVG